MKVGYVEGKSQNKTLGKLTEAYKRNPILMVFIRKDGDFQWLRYVSLLEFFCGRWGVSEHIPPIFLNVAQRGNITNKNKPGW